LKPSKFVSSWVSDGYEKDKLKMPRSSPTFELLLGSAQMKDIAVNKGKYDVTAQAAKWTCRVSETGFEDFWDDDCAITEGETRHKPIPMSPLLNPGHARFVLTWGETPKDFDISLSTPGGCQLTSFNRVCRGPDKLWARIDRDTSHGYGPETLTVLGFWDGEYILRASHFGRRGSINSATGQDSELTHSNALVTLYDDSEDLTRRWRLGQRGYIAGADWVICKITVAAGVKTFTPCTPELCPISDPTDPSAKPRG